MFVYNSYVESSNSVKWCVGKNCDMIVELDEGSRKEVDVQCIKCSTEFCFDCVKPAHQPIDCSGLKAWMKRINQDDTEDWMKANAKPCPKCKAPIAKMKGCMHMTCP